MMGHENAKGLHAFLAHVKNRLGTFNVKQCAMLIYTSNTMCARCAHSIVIDFERFFKKIIQQDLGLSALPQQVFIAGYQTPYVSNLHEIPKDSLEKFMSKGSSVIYGADDDLVPIHADGTFGSRGIEYGDNPPLIYHYLVSLTNDLRIAISHENIDEVRFLLSLNPNLREGDSHKWTALHILAQRDNSALHALIIDHLKSVKPTTWHNIYSLSEIIMKILSFM
jgi:hypothetical protein